MCRNQLIFAPGGAVEVNHWAVDYALRRFCVSGRWDIFDRVVALSHHMIQYAREMSD